MRAFIVVLGVILVGILIVYALGSDVDVRDSGELPDVDMTVEGGRMPDVDYTPPDVDVDMEERTVEYPSVDYEPAEDSPADEATEGRETQSERME